MLTTDPYFQGDPVEPGSIPYEKTTAGGRGDIDGMSALAGLAALAGGGLALKGATDLSNRKDARLGTWQNFRESFGEQFHARPGQGVDWDDPGQATARRSEFIDMLRDVLPKRFGGMTDEERWMRNSGMRWTERGDEVYAEPDPFTLHQGGPRKGEPVALTMPRLGEARPGRRGEEIPGAPDEWGKPTTINEPTEARATAANVAGGVAGRTAADLAGNGLLNLYWALNATQAVAHLGARIALQKGAGLRVHPLGFTKNSAGLEANVSDHMLDLMTLPTQVAINFGIGNTGRQPGFSVVQPSADDPTKTDDPVGELVGRYVLNRSGHILPWEKFRQERPDVSREQYDDYMNYLYNEKGLLGLNALKATMDGIDGPTMSFLGKDVSLAKGVLPTLGTILGTGIAARRARRKLGDAALNQRGGPASMQLMGETLVGSALGAAAGTAAGAASQALF